MLLPGPSALPADIAKPIKMATRRLALPSLGTKGLLESDRHILTISRHAQFLPHLLKPLQSLPAAAVASTRTGAEKHHSLGRKWTAFRIHLKC